MTNNDILLTPIRLAELDQFIQNSVRKALNDQQQPPSEPAEDIILIAEAAKVLNLAVPTLYSMVSRKEIPYMKRRQRLYFSRRELQKWITDGRRKTTEEIQQDAMHSLTQQGGDR